MGAHQRHHRRHRNELTLVRARFQVGAFFNHNARVEVRHVSSSPSKLGGNDF
jgi:hypothetical protein